MTDVLQRPSDEEEPVGQATTSSPPRGDGRRVRAGAGEASGGMLLLVFMALLALLVSSVAIALTRRGGGAASGATAPPQTFDVGLSDLKVTPAAVSVAQGAPVKLNVTNNGAIQHDLKAPNGKALRTLQPGESGTLDLGVVTNPMELWCTIPGHKAAGMTMSVDVAGAAAPAAGPGASESAAAAGADAKIDFSANPAAGWKPFDPALRAAEGGVEHKLTLHATEKVVEVAPGVTQQLWSFDGQTPGPTLRGKVGDLFTVTLVNDGKVDHSIDFHASRVAWNDEMRSIKPGESLVYQFRAEYAGAFMYHCGTPPALHHIGNGMFGAIIVDPPDLVPVAHEYVLVQSELYLGPSGEPGDLSKMTQDAWDAVVFNGYVNQYKHAPIRVEPNERVRVWVVDAGPSENSAFHIVGTVFDTVFKEGSYMLRPDQRQGGSQVLDLQPAQGGFVEFSFAEKGLYPIVTHKFSNPGKGALGLFQAGDVATPASGGGH